MATEPLSAPDASGSSGEEVIRSFRVPSQVVSCMKRIRVQLYQKGYQITTLYEFLQEHDPADQPASLGNFVSNEGFLWEVEKILEYVPFMFAIIFSANHLLIENHPRLLEATKCLIVAVDYTPADAAREVIAMLDRICKNHEFPKLVLFMGGNWRFLDTAHTSLLQQVQQLYCLHFSTTDDLAAFTDIMRHCSNVRHFKIQMRKELLSPLLEHSIWPLKVIFERHDLICEPYMAGLHIRCDSADVRWIVDTGIHRGILPLQSLDFCFNGRSECGVVDTSYMAKLAERTPYMKDLTLRRIGNPQQFEEFVRLNLKFAVLHGKWPRLQSITFIHVGKSLKHYTIEILKLGPGLEFSPTVHSVDTDPFDTIDTYRITGRRRR